MTQQFRRWIGAAATAFVAAVLTVGCDSGTTADSSGSASAKKLRLAFVTNNASDFWIIARAGCEQAVKDVGNVDLIFQLPQDGAAATQKRLIEDILAKGVDGIACSPKDPENQTPILNEAASRALLITHDSDAPKSNRACYVGTDNFAAGEQAGQLIKEALPNGGKIMVFVGTLDAQNAKDRFEGIKKAIAGSKVEILGVKTDEVDRIRAKSNVTDAMLANPDLACVVGLWSYNGPAILSAVKDANKVGTMKIVCFDEEKETLQGVREGAIYGTVVQQPYQFGYQAIKLMAEYLRGDKSVIPDSKQIIVPTLMIKKDGVDKFEADLHKMLGK
jgi:ribose transport system substrate-binding protein